MRDLLICTLPEHGIDNNVGDISAICLEVSRILHPKRITEARFPGAIVDYLMQIANQSQRRDQISY